jgi:hypothetical protein
MEALGLFLAARCSIFSQGNDQMWAVSSRLPRSIKPLLQAL